MPDLYRKWCCCEREASGRKKLWCLTEREGGRDVVLNDLSGRVQNHYISHEVIAGYIEKLGFSETASIIQDKLPTSPIGRSGDLGEILASEFVEDQLDFKVPVKRLRYTDHREMAMRGDDVIAVTYDEQQRLRILKGEVKSAQHLRNATVEEARKRLEENYGRPSGHSMIFISQMLMECEDPTQKALGADIARARSGISVPKERLVHFLFTLCGNSASHIVRKDLDAADGGREQHSVNLRIENHRRFVDTVYEEASSIGND